MKFFTTVAVAIALAHANGAIAGWCGCWQTNGRDMILWKEDRWYHALSESCCMRVTEKHIMGGDSFFGATSKDWCDTGNKTAEYRQCCNAEAGFYAYCK